MQEAPLEETDNGRVPTGEGWFVLNARDVPWVRSERRGAACYWEHELPWQLGVTLSVLQPVQSGGLYHREGNQEGFLVLAGEGIVIVDGEERPLRAWDFFHCPAGTPHVLLGTGDSPFVFFAGGSRNEGAELVYPVEEAALRRGAGVEREATSGRDAYPPNTWQPGRYADDLP